MSTSSTNPGDRSAAEIEREVDRERSELANTIDQLQNKLSVSSVIDEVVDAVGKHGGDVGRNLGRTVRDNPLPLILTSVGLAWLMASSGEREPRLPRYDYDDDWDAADDRVLGAPDYGTDRFGTAPATDPMVSGSVYGEPYYGDSDPALDTDTTGLDTGASSGPSMRDRVSGAAGGASARASAAAGSVSERAARVRDSARRGISGASSRASEGYYSAQDRVRSAAYDAQRWGDRNRQMLRENMEDAIEEQPLVLGALALAIGAAVGGALPRTRTEDELMGEQSDRLKNSAMETAGRQADKAMAVAGAVADEGMKMADEAVEEVDRRTPDGASAVESAETLSRNAAERLRKAGEDEAKRQNEKDSQSKS